MAEKKNTFVNVDFSKDVELLEDLDSMVEADEMDRSKMIRKLIRQEKLRRAGQLPEQLPLPIHTTEKSRKATTANRTASVAA
jgi:hypothetical protein